jgi:ribonuclease HII
MLRQESSREATGLSAGLDEVGRGCLAGPMCVAVAAFPKGATPIPGVDDSKKLSFKKRMELAPIIMKEAVFFGIGWAHPTVIDEYGVTEAWQRACHDALEGAPHLNHLHVDGVIRVDNYIGAQTTYIKGDSLLWEISAASIVAKVIRDLDIIDMSPHYPAYKWEKNMGYGSQAHLDALFRLGPCSYHRGSYLKKVRAKFASQINEESPLWKQWASQWDEIAPRY